MNSFRVDILNPKATKLLKDLENLKLISIRKDNPDFFKVLNRLIKHSKSSPSLEEITKEVEAVRSKRYKK